MRQLLASAAAVAFIGVYVAVVCAPLVIAYRRRRSRRAPRRVGIDLDARDAAAHGRHPQH